MVALVRSRGRRSSSGTGARLALPAAFLARGVPHAVYGALAPLLGLLFLRLAIGVWRLSLRFYGSTGW